MWKHPLRVFALILLSCLLAFFLLTRGHPWWDDFAAYVMQAQAILSGDMQGFLIQNAFTVQNSSYPPGPVAYPWGFPLLLAPVLALAGVHPLALKLVGVGAYAFFLFFFYWLARTRLSEQDSLLLLAVLAVNPALLLATDLILSDLPFLAISTLGLLLAERYAGAQGRVWAQGIALGLVIFGAAFLRTNGILLLAPVGVALATSPSLGWGEKLRRGSLPFLSFTFFYVVSVFFFPNGESSYLTHFSLFSLPRLWDNLLFYLWLPWRLFEYLPAAALFYPLLAFFLLFSLARNGRRDAAWSAYGGMTMALFVLWPERQGLRFLYPVLPLLLIMAAEGMRLALPHFSLWARAFWLGLALLSLVVSLQFVYTNLQADRGINGPFDPYSDEAFAFVRAETKADAVILFARPRALRLFTARPSFMTTRCEDLPKGDYLLLHEKMGDVGQIDPQKVENCGVRLQKVFGNKRFSLYRIAP